MIRRLSTAVAVLALLLAACGDDDDAEETSDTTEPTSETSSAAGGDDYGSGGGGDGSANGKGVTIVDFAFDPSTIEVAAGSTVTWTNEDGVTHTVTAGAPGSAEETFDESLDGGATAEVTFDEAGTFPYFCAIHTDMTGEVVVS